MKHILPFKVLQGLQGLQGLQNFLFNYNVIVKRIFIHIYPTLLTFYDKLALCESFVLAVMVSHVTLFMFIISWKQY